MILRLEAHGEPVVDLSEHRTGFVATTGVAQKSRRLVVARSSNERASSTRAFATARRIAPSTSSAHPLAEVTHPEEDAARAPKDTVMLSRHRNNLCQNRKSFRWPLRRQAVQRARTQSTRTISPAGRCACPQELVRYRRRFRPPRLARGSITPDRRSANMVCPWKNQHNRACSRIPRKSRRNGIGRVAQGSEPGGPMD